MFLNKLTHPPKRIIFSYSHKALKNSAGMEFNMRFVIQRVNHASVKIDGEVVGNIGHGLLILFGAGQDDTEEMLPKYVDKICKMRILKTRMAKLICLWQMSVASCLL